MTKWMVGLAALLTLVLAPSAWADYGQVGQFADQAADGNPVHQQRIAVNATTHTAYVADTVGDQVRVFTPSGTSATEGAPFGAGDLTDPLGIAVDQDTGDVYVSDDDDILKYSSAGVRDNTFPSLAATGPLAFDQTANELVVGAGTVVRRFSTAGVAGATFDGTSGSTAFAGIQDLAVDSAGNVVVVDSDGNPVQGTGTSRVERFAPDGTHQLTFGPVPMAATVAIEPGSDRVAVSGNQDGNVRGELPTVTVFDPATPGTPVGSAALPGSLLYSAIRALAFDGSRLYVGTDVGDYFGGFGYGSVTIQVFEAGPDPRLAAASNLTTNGATLNGTINPQGGGSDTTYRFELSSDGGATWNAVDPDNDGDENAGQGTTAVPISQTITGLTSTAAYSVRLVAVRGSVTITSSVRTFTTGDVAPEATTGDATVGDITATLVGRVTPNGAETTYVFEYGTTTSYGSQYPASTPRPAGNAATGDRLARVIVPQLQPATTYHYRLKATNGGGTTTGPDQTFTTRPAPSPATSSCPNAAIRQQQRAEQLFDCRAYEQVTPTTAKNGNSLRPSHTVQSAAEGDAVAFSSSGAFAGAPTSLAHGYYQARRQGSNWDSKSVDLPQTNTTAEGPQYGYSSVFFSDDLTVGLYASGRALAPGAAEDGGNVYRRDDRTGDLTTVFSEPDPLGAERVLYALTNPVSVVPKYVTPDLSQFAFNSPFNHIADAPATNAQRNAYVAEAGSVRLVNRESDGSPIDSESSVAGMSANGERVFFTSNTTPDGLPALYLRENDATTTLISYSRRPGADPTEPLFADDIRVSEDGSVVYFTSNQGLLPGGANFGADLFRYNTDTNTLSRVSTERNGGVSRIFTVDAMSPDGETLYFTAFGDLAPDGDATPNAKQYVYHNGEVRFIAEASGTSSGNPAKISPSGRYFAFAPSADTGGFDNTGCGSTCEEVYVYDAETDELSCASCRFTGAKNATSSLLYDERHISNHRARSVTDDGQVFFNSKEPLVARDTNGRDDVYQWKDGVTTLISPGNATADATFSDATEDGSRVYFVTGQKVVPQDRDSLVDLYVARPDGGIDSQMQPPAGGAECEGDSCQGAPTAIATPPLAGSVDFSGPGNTPAAKRTSSKLTVARGVSARGSVFRLRVKTPAEGRLRITGTEVRTATRSASRAATYTIRVQLTAKARRTLHKKRALRVKVRITYTSSAGKRTYETTTVRLKA